MCYSEYEAVLCSTQKFIIQSFSYSLPAYVLITHLSDASDDAHDCMNLNLNKLLCQTLFNFITGWVILRMGPTPNLMIPHSCGISSGC